MSQYDPKFDLKTKLVKVGHNDIFCGPVILPYILMSISCINTILSDYESE